MATLEPGIHDREIAALISFQAMRQYAVLLQTREEFVTLGERTGLVEYPYLCRVAKTASGLVKSTLAVVTRPIYLVDFIEPDLDAPHCPLKPGRLFMSSPRAAPDTWFRRFGVAPTNGNGPLSGVTFARKQ